MNNLTGLFAKYSKFISREAVLRDFTIQAFKKLFSVDIKKSEIKVVRGSIILSCHPALIFQAKKHEKIILEEINKNPHGFIAESLK